MKRKISYIYFFLFLSFGCLAQQARQVNVKNVKFNLNTAQRVIEITYDVDNISLDDSVYIMAQNKKGAKYIAKTISGDVGKGIIPGENKKIVWDFITDSLRVNEEIGITVFVQLYNYYQAKAEETDKAKYKEKEEKTEAKPEPKPEVATTKPPKIPKVKVPKEKGGINKTALVILGAGVASGGYLIYSGNSQLQTAKDYYNSYISSNWNQKLSASDDEYLKQYSQFTINNASQMLETARSKQKTAQIVLYSGIGLVVADAVLMIPRLRKNKDTKKVSFSPAYNPYSNSLIFNANFKF